MSADDYENGDDLHNNEQPNDRVSDENFSRACCQITKMAVPMTLSFTLSIEIFVSSLLLGYISHETKNETEYRSAIALVTSVVNTLLLIGLSPIFGISPISSNKQGDYRTSVENKIPEDELAIKRQAISVTNRVGLIMTMAASPPLFLLLFFSSSILQTVFQQSPASSDIVQEYTRTYAFSVPAVLARMVFEQNLFPAGKARDMMLIGLATFALGTAISCWLGFGGLGVQSMGPSGVALGYVVEAWIIAFAYAGYLAWHGDLKLFSFFKLCGYEKEAIAGVAKSICAQSIPVSINMLTEVLMEFIASILSGLVGLSSQAVISYSLQFVYLLFVPLAAFGITSAQEVGREVGARNFSYASKLSMYSVIVTLFFLTPPLATIVVYPAGLIDLFSGPLPTNGTNTSFDVSTARMEYSGLNQNSTLIDANDVVARIMAAAVFLDAIRYNVLSQLRSIGDPWVSIVLSNAALILGFILSGTLGLHTSLGEYGVAAGYLAGVLFADIALIPRLSYLRRIEQLKKVTDKLNNPPSCLAETSRFFCSCVKKRSERDLDTPLLRAGDEAGLRS